jgi:cardiolipin synthase
LSAFLWGAVFASVATILIFGLVLVIFARSEKEITQRVDHLYSITDPQFLRSMNGLLGPTLVAGNRVETLLNGDEIFPAMLKAIRAAEKTVTFETFIYWSGNIGQEFVDTLSEKARQGVKVHVLLDWFGSLKMEESWIQKMRDAGIEAEKYHPLKWHNWRRLNNRTHHKILVVDGKIGFTGGVGIADEWSGHAQGSDHWRDTHYRIEGPVVAQLQSAFIDNWIEVKGDVLHSEEYFPELKETGPHLAQVFKSSREGGANSAHLMYLLAISAAKKSIHLSMAYFLPDSLAQEAMVAALKRGVAIQIILPSRHIDRGYVRKASRGTWGPLLEAGAEIFEFQPTMFHCKILIIDGIYACIGSTNFDNRSFRLNDEANLNIYEVQFAERQLADFKADLKRSRQITLSEWKKRPWAEKVLEYGLKMIRPQL